MARVLMAASEAAPFVKTGGLADVLGGLPPALAKLGDEVTVIIPKYRKVELFGAERIYHELPVWLGSTLYNTAIDRVIDRGVSYLFVHCPPLFDREGIYNVANQDYPDNHIRFAAFSRAAMEGVRRIYRPHVIHCHDWQAAMIAPYIRHTFAGDPTFAGLRLLLTIHNLGYQGLFGSDAAPQIGIDPGLCCLPGSPLEFYGNLNVLKGGIHYADAITTVSRTYAKEIQTPEFGFGLDGLLRSRAHVLTGIVNGVDYSQWNPEHDRLLPANYSADSLEGKRECKRKLLEEMGLPVDLERPLIGVVSRFAAQKGFDLIAEIAPGLMDLDVSLAVLGSGDPGFEQFFRDLAAAKPDRVGVRIGYDNPLAHRIEAGADMFLMPSRYEPCGLNQIYSLRYGTLPLVRATGGLDDTIGEGTGFKFWGYTGHELYECILGALKVYADREQWAGMVQQAMREDFSWDVAAREYSALYRKLTGRSGTAAA
jgi:starch synthase